MANDIQTILTSVQQNSYIRCVVLPITTANHRTLYVTLTKKLKTREPTWQMTVQLETCGNYGLMQARSIVF